MKVWQIILVCVVAVAALVMWKREPLMMAYVASNTAAGSLEDRTALIADAIEIQLPEGAGDGPFPVVLQFHGCAGIRAPFQEQWADVANRAGYAAVIVDSTGPRGYSRQEALDIVCAGEALLGQERAGDVMAAIQLAEANPQLDAERIVLAGWSHGAWSIMDYLTMDFEGRWPAGVQPANYEPPQALGAIVFYPYCGAGSLSRFRNWPQTTDVLALIAGADSVVNADECVAHFEKRKTAGDPIDMTIYPGAEHVFDDPFLEPEYIHWYNAAFFKDAKQRYETFLKAYREITSPATH